MFKKSEEQEWTRFRGALSKDRDEAPAPPPAPEPNDTPTGVSIAPGVVAGQVTAGPSFRSVGDVNVGLATSRLTRSPVSEGVEIESLIGERTTFEGTLKTEGAVRVLGVVQGEIESKSTIIIEEKARVTARLTGAQVTIAGRVDGQILCDGRVEIRPSGHVTGEINAGSLIIQEGAYFDGSSKMSGGATTAGSATQQAAAVSGSNNHVAPRAEVGSRA